MEDFIECFLLYEICWEKDFPVSSPQGYRMWLRHNDKLIKKFIINPRYIKTITPISIEDKMYRYCIEMHDKSVYYVDVVFQLEKLITI